ncbi:MAG: efflux RND transporter periplasmic adaptor subunit [Deltaproteobacteria bacterium]|nr:efflux RND transporter periplasmic adaptor subunit [Deltaproteobacteria bacterium]
MGKARKRLLHVILTVLIVAGGAFGMVKLTASRTKLEKRKPPVRVPMVRALEVRTRPSTVWVSCDGTVKPLQQIQLVPQVAGKVVEVSPNLVNGGAFRKGEVLLRIDPTDYEVAVTLARARVKDAESRLRLAVEESEAAREEWRQLHIEGTGGDITPPPLVAKEPQLAAARASLEAERANLKKAMINLDRTIIRAPFEGRVAQENVDVGQYVAPGQPLGTLYATTSAQIVVPLEQADLYWIHVPGFTPGTGLGSPALVRARIAGEDRVWQGRVVRAEGILDQRTRMINVVVEVKGPYARKPPLAVGLFARVEIRGKRLPQAAIIPRAALRAGNTVWIVNEDGKLRFRKVKVARIERDKVLIRSGLEDGDRVVVSHLKAVTDRMHVRCETIPGEEKGS